MMGRLADLEGPPALVSRAVDAFVRVYRVDMSEAEIPDGGYETFDAFFTRRLRDGARVVDADPDTLVCPADGRLLDAGPIDRGAAFRIKGRLYDAGELLGDAREAEPFLGGHFAVVYLAPPDYHRVHAPVSGRVIAMRHVDGTLYPVNAIGMEHVQGLFAANERVAVHQRAQRFGAVATVLVGAIGVGRIGLAFDELLTNTGRAGGLFRYDETGPTLERGDELGAFHLGSTVIVLAAANDLALGPAIGDRVRVGEALFRAPRALGGVPGRGSG
jgi:phosphatidylserine decarboxylase